MEWFAAAGEAPRARIELNYDAAMRSLVAAGYGAALLPLQQDSRCPLNERMQVAAAEPAAHAPARHRAPAAAPLDGATESVLQILARFSQA